MSSVSLSATLEDSDHIGWKPWKLIAHLPFNVFITIFTVTITSIDEVNKLVELYSKQDAVLSMGGPRDAAGIFGMYRSLQRHRAVFTAIAMLSN